MFEYIGKPPTAKELQGQARAGLVLAREALDKLRELQRISKHVQVRSVRLALASIAEELEYDAHHLEP